jgi:hypothetical protein
MPAAPACFSPAGSGSWPGIDGSDNPSSAQAGRAFPAFYAAAAAAFRQMSLACARGSCWRLQYRGGDQHQRLVRHLPLELVFAWKR